MFSGQVGDLVIMKGYKEDFVLFARFWKQMSARAKGSIKHKDMTSVDGAPSRYRKLSFIDYYVDYVHLSFVSN